MPKFLRAVGDTLINIDEVAAIEPLSGEQPAQSTCVMSNGKIYQVAGTRDDVLQRIVRLDSASDAL